MVENRWKSPDNEAGEVQDWLEWWCLRELLLNICGERFAPSKIVKIDPPDFQIECDAGECLFIEVSKATDSSDEQARREFAKTGGGVRLLGEKFQDADGKEKNGGRFEGGSFGDEWEDATADDVRRIVTKKMAKMYPPRTSLLIYADSNASGADNVKVESRLRQNFPKHQFDAVYVLQSGGFISSH